MYRYVAIILFNLFTGCSLYGQQKTFKNKQCQYEFKYLNGWTIRSNQCITDVIAPDGHPNELGKEILSISRERTLGKSFEECYKLYVTDYFDTENRSVKAYEDIVINDHKARWIEYEHEKGGMLRTDLICLVYSDDFFFLIRGISSQKYYLQYRDGFKLIINSFVVK